MKGEEQMQQARLAQQAVAYHLCDSLYLFLGVLVCVLLPVYDRSIAKALMVLEQNENLGVGGSMSCE